MNVTISKDELQRAIEGLNFGAGAAFADSGTFDAAGNLTIDSAKLRRLENLYAPKPGQKPLNEAAMKAMFQPPTTRLRLPTDADVSAWLAICADCPFVKKLDGGVLKCAHKNQTCPTCSQGTSGLAAALKTFSFRCPENKLTKL